MPVWSAPVSPDGAGWVWTIHPAVSVTRPAAAGCLVVGGGLR